MKIKSKSFSLFILPLLVSFIISIQVNGQSSRRMGIKGGVNVSNLFIDKVTDENARIGFHAGVYGQLFSSDVITLQTELLYSTKGSKSEFTNGSFNQSIQFNLNYIDLPILVVFKAGSFLEIHLGGYASYLINANITYKGDAINAVNEIKKGNLKSYDYGLAGGLGFNVNHALQVGVRYNYGLVKIADSAEAKSLLGDARNSVAQVFLAFNLSGE